MADTLAWRASTEFGAAIRNFQAEKQSFIDAVIMPFDREHPNNPTAWRRAGFSLDLQCCGFKDQDDDAPAGLSRAQTRSWLVPARGAAGKEWRAVLERMAEMPSLDKVFAEHGVASFFLAGNRVVTPGFFSNGTDVYLQCTADIAKPRENADPSTHLTPIKLSEFYAAKEATEASHA